MKHILWTAMFALAAIFFGHHAKAGELSFDEVKNRLVAASGIEGIEISFNDEYSRTWGTYKKIELGPEAFYLCKNDMECVGWVLAHEMGHVANGHYRDANIVDEWQADKYAPRLMRKAGLNPLKGIIFLRNARLRQGGVDYGGPDHPNFSDRILYLQTWGGNH